MNEMVNMRKIETKTEDEAITNPNPQNMNDQTPKISPYEQSREERIKANLERMQKLGLVDLSLKLKSLKSPPPKRTPRTTPSSAKHYSPLFSSQPTRRSSRLNSATPVSYSEAALAKQFALLENENVMVEEGSKPEVYTEEHEKLLGNTVKSWTLFVDGYGKDGKRIYDQVKGKTCHQCRQKTLGHRTHCSRCQIVQGQFCGDCLYMRYGEHVLEAIENPNWICPVCRGICNCSLCRQAKGWAPTGSLYRKISREGYKSVAHYLIQTRRAQNTIETVNVVSAKRSLPFSEKETLSNISPQVAVCEDKRPDKLKNDEEKLLPNSGSFGSDCPIDNSVTTLRYDHFELSKDAKQVLEDKNEKEFKVEEEKKLHLTDKEDCRSKVALGSSPKIVRKRGLAFQPSPDSIGARLRRRCRKINGQENAGWTDMNENNCDVKQSVNNMFVDQKAELEDAKDTNSIIGAESGPKLKKKSAETNPDSIGVRLRQRRRMSKSYDDKLPA